MVVDSDQLWTWWWMESERGRRTRRARRPPFPDEESGRSAEDREVERWKTVCLPATGAAGAAAVDASAGSVDARRYE